MPLFAPLLAKLTHRRFDPSEFARGVEEMYGIPMSPLVAEGLVEKLAEAKLLRLEDAEARTYRIEPVEIAAGSLDETGIDLLLQEFVTFAEKSLVSFELRKL